MRGVKNDIPQPFKTARSPFYWFKYYDSTGKRKVKSTGKSTIKEAREVIAEFLKIAHTDIKSGETTFKDYSKPFFDEPLKCPVLSKIIDRKGTVSRGTCMKWQSGLWRIVGHQAENKNQFSYPKQPFAEIPMNQITFRDVEGLFYHLRDIYTPHTLKAVRQSLSAILNYAVRQGHIANNPIQGVRLDIGPRVRTYTAEEATQENFEDHQEKLRAFNLEEIAILWENRNKLVIRSNGVAYPRDLILISLLFMGMRNQEARGLQWKDVDLENGKLSITKAIKRDYTNGLVVGPTKTGQVRKNLPIPNEILNDLKNYRAIKHAQAPVYVKPNSFVIHDKALGPLTYDTVSFFWSDIVRKNLESIGLGSKVSLSTHSLRRSINTALKTVYPIGTSAVNYYLGWEDTNKGVGDTHYLVGAEQQQSLKAVSEVIDRILQGNPPRIRIE